MFALKLAVLLLTNLASPGLAAHLDQEGNGKPTVHSLPAVTVQSSRGTDLHQIPITLSQVGVEGDFDVGMTPAIHGRPIPAQVDVLRRHEDGSIRHALVSFEMPVLMAGSPMRVDFQNRVAPDPGNFEWLVERSKLDLRVALQPTGMGSIEVRLGERPRMLHDGPVMKELEFHQAVPLAESGRKTLLDVFVRLRVYSGSESIRVAVIVENTRPWSKAIQPWKPIWEFDGLEIFSGQDKIHAQGPFQFLDRTRFRIVTWIGEPVEFRCHPDVGYLERGNFIPPYRPVGSPTAAGMEKRLLGHRPVERFQILRPGVIHEHMPGTGGRPDIGPYPAWAYCYLHTRSTRLYDALLHADGNGGGSFPIHVRQTAKIPGFQIGRLARTPNGARKMPHRKNTVSKTEADIAHVPSIGYLSYMLTGDLFHAEEMAFWASHQTRGLDRGAPERVQAWSLRSVVDAAYLLPVDNPLQPYFQGKVESYLEKFTQSFVLSGRPVHFFRDVWNGSGAQFWVNCRFTAPWQTSWHVWSLGNAVDKGFEGAVVPRQWLAEFIVGLYTSDDEFLAPDGRAYRFDPKDAMAPRLATTLVPTRISKRRQHVESIPTGDGRPLESYGEIWYYTKVNEDNSYFPKLQTRPNKQGVWPLRNPGWGHGLYKDGSKALNYERYGALNGLVSAINGEVEKAEAAWRLSSSMMTPQGSNLYGFDMAPRKYAGLE